MTPSHWPLGAAGVGVYALVVLVAFFFMLRSIARRFRLLQIGRPAPRFDRLVERVEGVLKFAIAQARMPNYPLVGVIHIIVFWCFLLVVSTNLTLLIQGFAGADFSLPLLGESWMIGRVYRVVLDLFEVLTVFAVTVAIFNRLVLRPKRLTVSMEAVLILGIIGTMMLADLFYEATGGLLRGHEPLGIGASTLYGWLKGTSPESLQMLWGLSWWVHVGLILGFGNLLPFTKHFHVITSLPNVFFRDLDGPKKLSTYKINMETGDVPAGVYGIGKMADFSWKDNLDFYTCTECGRCSDNCPANLSGKPLSPKFLTVALRDHLYHNDANIKAKAQTEKRLDPNTVDADFDPTAIPNEVSPLVIEEEILWSCTTCRACEVACPVFISYVDKIVDMRRRLQQGNNRFPKELKRMYQGMENQGNPWGQNAEKRLDWVGDLDIKMMADVQEAEYLYFVGCASAFDERMKRVTQAVAKILTAAKVDFAILGSEESCTGDPARRSGNEFLFQTLVGMNVETFKQYKFKKIITHCPHCFNTLKNEYPEFGASYEVVHHTEIIDKLMSEGRLTPKQGLGMRVVYHDSCYLGRYNEVYEAPRDLVAWTGSTVLEPPRARKAGLCCGAGGARMWMEEKIGTRMNHERFDLLMSTQPDAIAVACPFCMTMIGDAAKDKDSEVPIYDVSELVLRTIEGPQKAATKDAAE
jgi:Fe-S oxidoreductase